MENITNIDDNLNKKIKVEYINIKKPDKLYSIGYNNVFTCYNNDDNQSEYSGLFYNNLFLNENLNNSNNSLIINERKMNIYNINSEKENEIMNEVNKFKECIYPSLINYDVKFDCNLNKIILKYEMSIKTLWDLITYRDKIKLNNFLKFEIIRDISKALEYLHSKHIVHGNINLNTMIITQNNTGINVKLGGLGIYKYLNNLSKKEEVNINFDAPEVLEQINNNEIVYTKESDIYSFSICANQIIKNESVIYPSTIINQTKEIITLKRRPNIFCPKTNFEVDFKDIISGNIINNYCQEVVTNEYGLAHNPINRPTIEKFVELCLKYNYDNIEIIEDEITLSQIVQSELIPTNYSIFDFIISQYTDNNNKTTLCINVNHHLFEGDDLIIFMNELKKHYSFYDDDINPFYDGEITEFVEKSIKENSIIGDIQTIYKINNIYIMRDYYGYYYKDNENKDKCYRGSELYLLAAKNYHNDQESYNAYKFIGKKMSIVLDEVIKILQW